MADYDKVMQKLDYLDDTKSQIKDAIEIKGQDISQEDTFRDYVEKIMQIHDGDVKLFNNEIEMYADDKAKENDLAIIYNTEMTPLYYGSSFSAIKISKSLQFTNALPTSSFYMSCNGVNGYGSLYMSRQTGSELGEMLYINLNCSKRYGISLYYLIDAEDRTKAEFSYGYVYKDSGTEIFVFDTDDFVYEFFDILTWNSNSSYSNVFTGAFDVRYVWFGGLYQYCLNTRQEDSVYMGVNPDIDPVTLNSTITLTDWLSMRYANNNVCNMTSRNYFGGLMKINSYSTYTYETTYNEPTNFDIYLDRFYIFNYNDKHYLYTEYGTDESIIDSNIETAEFEKINVDFNNWTYNISYLPKTKLTVTKNETNYYFLVVAEFTDEDILTAWYFNNEYGGSPNGMSVLNYELLGSQQSAGWFSFPPAFVDKYIEAPNQFTARDNSYIVTGYSALGSGGSLYGDGTYLKHITSSEFRNYFMPYLPASYNTSTYYNNIIQYGESVPYLQLVNRSFRRNDDETTIPNTSALVVKMESETAATITEGNTEAIASSANSQYNSFRHNNKVYYGYYGFNYNSNDSSSRNTIRRVYGLIYNLTDNEVYKTFNVDFNKRFFSDQGGWQGNDVCHIYSMGYDWANNQFVITVDTGNSGYSNGAWFGYMYLNADTGAIVKEKKWNLGKYGPSRGYYQVDDPMYNPSDRSFILPIHAFDSSGSNGITATVLKINSSDSISTLFTTRNSVDMSGYSYIGGEYGFYKENCPLLFYRYTYENTTHCYFRNVVTNVELDITDVYTGWPSFNTSVIVQDKYMYLIASNRVNNQYQVIKLDSSDMTYELIPVGNSYPSHLLLVDGIIHIVVGNTICSLDNPTVKLYDYYNSTNMYNDRSADGVIDIDGMIQGEVYKLGRTSGGLTQTKYKQKLYVYEKCNSIPADQNKDLFITWPTSVGSGTLGNTNVNLTTSVPLKYANIPSYDNTLTPEEYNEALEKANYIKTNETGGGV